MRLMSVMSRRSQANEFVSEILSGCFSVSMQQVRVIAPCFIGMMKRTFAEMLRSNPRTSC